MRKLAIVMTTAGLLLSPLLTLPAAAENDRYEVEVKKAEAAMQAFNDKREARLKEKAERAESTRDRYDDWGGWPAWFGFDRDYRYGDDRRDRKEAKKWRKAQQATWQERHRRAVRDWRPAPWYDEREDRAFGWRWRN